MHEGERPEAEDLRVAGTDRDRRLAAHFDAHRSRLERMVDLRIDPALRARLGASDVLQEAWIEVRERIGEWIENPAMPFYVWVRFLAAQRLAKLHRFHLGAQKRDARRQVADDAGMPATTAAGLVDRLAATGFTPSGVAVVGEARRRLHEAMEGLEPLDREVLALRHFEEMSNADVALALGIRPDAASKRYLRALERLKRALEGPGGPST